MKQYKHKKTGVIVSVNSEIDGEWEPFEAPKAETPAEEKPKKKASKKGEEE